MISHYEVLEVPQDADGDAIKSSYRRKVRAVHPDVIGEETGLFRMVQAAYETLSDPAKRRAYDAELAGGRPAGSDDGVTGDDAADAGSSDTSQSGGWDPSAFSQHVRDERARREGVDAGKLKREARKREAEARESERAEEAAKVSYRGRAWLLVLVTFVGGWWGVRAQDWESVQRMHDWADIHGWGPSAPMSEEISARALSYGLMNAVLWRLGYAFRRRAVQDPWPVVIFVPLLVSMVLWGLSPTLNLLYKDLTFLLSIPIAVAWAFPASYSWVTRWTSTRAKRRGEEQAGSSTGVGSAAE